MYRATRTIALCFLVLLSIAAFADTLTGKVVKVADGDSITVLANTNTQHRIRLHGIDAPESNQTCSNADGTEWRCGEEAILALANIILNHSITCRGDVRGIYGRLIAA